MYRDLAWVRYVIVIVVRTVIIHCVFLRVPCLHAMRLHWGGHTHPDKTPLGRKPPFAAISRESLKIFSRLSGYKTKSGGGWKLALTRSPDPIRPTPRGPDPNRPAYGSKEWELWPKGVYRGGGWLPLLRDCADNGDVLVPGTGPRYRTSTSRLGGSQVHRVLGRHSTRSLRTARCQGLVQEGSGRTDQR